MTRAALFCIFKKHLFVFVAPPQRGGMGVITVKIIFQTIKLKSKEKTEFSEHKRCTCLYHGVEKIAGFLICLLFFRQRVAASLFCTAKALHAAGEPFCYIDSIQK
ncbi:MAG: hypothetical protein D3910_02110 [Candidatus Electrothrix sp. ATG2]|nr:hypothetical protein [Candidatus Electrothrix sp. ATG2]